MRSMRWRLGRFLMHMGLNVLPQGRARAEISEMLWEWRAHVEATLATHRALPQLPSECPAPGERVNG
jgi:hypothetical protein